MIYYKSLLNNRNKDNFFHNALDMDELIEMVEPSIMASPIKLHKKLLSAEKPMGKSSA